MAQVRWVEKQEGEYVGLGKHKTQDSVLIGGLWAGGVRAELLEIRDVTMAPPMMIVAIKERPGFEIEVGSEEVM